MLSEHAADKQYRGAQGVDLYISMCAFDGWLVDSCGKKSMRLVVGLNVVSIGKLYNEMGV